MTKAQQVIVMFDSPEAAQPHTMTGWKSRDGFFFEDESSARYSGCTHRLCEACGKPVVKHHTRCPQCREDALIKKFASLPIVEWTKGPACLFDGDRFFSDEDEAIDYAEENDLRIEDLKLMACEPVFARELELDDYADDLPEDGELPGEIAAAMTAYNQAVKASKQPLSWRPVDKRISLQPRSAVTA